jgi:putative ABC transport system ATP-binding protein
MNHLVCDFKNVTLSYHHQKNILDIPSFEMRDGERVFLCGPSGCGKSSFLGIVAGVVNASQGEVFVLGENYKSLSPREKDKLRGEKMGYIFQLFNLIPYLSVMENILLPSRLNMGRMKKFESEKKMLTQASYLCEKFHINSLIKEKVSKISIGQQQRVAAARALLGNPQLIIADEPTSALDQDMQRIFLTQLIEQCEEQKTALLFVSHDKRLASFFDREIYLPELNRA